MAFFVPVLKIQWSVIKSQVTQHKTEWTHTFDIQIYGNESDINLPTATTAQVFSNPLLTAENNLFTKQLQLSLCAHMVLIQCPIHIDSRVTYDVQIPR